MIQRVCTPEEFLELEPRERLAFARKQIELEREAWNQDLWLTVDYRSSSARVIEGLLEDSRLCGTAACLAGWVAILAGERMIRTNSGHVVLQRGPWSAVADELLGLSGTEHRLYSGSSSLEDIDREIARLDKEMSPCGGSSG